MSSSQHTRKNASVGQPDKYDELDMRGLYRSPHLRERPVMGMIDNATELLTEAAATTEDGQPLHPTVHGEIAAERDYDWSRNPNGVDHGGHPGETLAQQETRLGQEAEIEANSENARQAEAHGIERERSCRVTTVYEEAERRVEMDERARLAAGEDPAIVDPREELTQEDLAAVNLQAYRLADRLKNGPAAPGIARRLAWRVHNGQGISEAVLEVRDEIYEESGVVQPIETVDPWDYEVSIEGVVDRLFEPASSSQQQVGYVRDETGSIKVTIWEKSGQSTILSEGDRVRILYGKPGSYKGQPTLAVVWESIVEVLDEGDGPAPVHGVRYAAGWKHAEESPTTTQDPKACTVPSPTDSGSQSVPRSEAGRFRGEERWIYPAEACPEWFREQENVEEYDSELEVR